MPRTRRQAKPLDTIWEVSDDLWSRIDAILRTDWRPSPKGGQPPKDWRPMFNAIIHRFRSGCQWNHLPKHFGSDRTIHRWFQRWCRHGVMAKIWAALLAECDELAGVQWDWQSADGRLGKARFGGDKVGKNPTDRGKNGTKQSIVVDGAGGPLGAVIAAANVNDHLLLDATVAAIVVERPTPTAATPQHLCLDAGYDNAPSRKVAAKHQYTPHICPRVEEQRQRRRGVKARRWVVERTLAWLSKCRGLLVRYDKHDVNYLGLLQLACGLLWYRRMYRLQTS
jgi:putative transposase